DLVVNKRRPWTEDSFMLTRGRAEELTGKFEGKRLIVLGDVMLDEFIWGSVRRISPEAPVPVVEIERQTVALGGAGNVTANLAGFGARPLQIGVVGADPDADRLKSAFERLAVPTHGLVVDAERPTTLKTRIIAQHQQVERADREIHAPLAAETENRMAEIFKHDIGLADALIVSDYGKAVLSPRLLESVLGLARNRGVAVVLDPKSRNFARYQPVTVITPNHHEAAEAAGVEIDGEAAVVQAGRKI